MVLLHLQRTAAYEQPLMLTALGASQPQQRMSHLFDILSVAYSRRMLLFSCGLAS